MTTSIDVSAQAPRDQVLTSLDLGQLPAGAWRELPCDDVSDCRQPLPMLTKLLYPRWRAGRQLPRALRALPGASNADPEADAEDTSCR